MALMSLARRSSTSSKTLYSRWPSARLSSAAMALAMPTVSGRQREVRLSMRPKSSGVEMGKFGLQITTSVSVSWARGVRISPRPSASIVPPAMQ